MFRCNHNKHLKFKSKNKWNRALSLTSVMLFNQNLTLTKTKKKLSMHQMRNKIFSNYIRSNHPKAMLTNYLDQAHRGIIRIGIKTKLNYNLINLLNYLINWFLSHHQNRRIPVLKLERVNQRKSHWRIVGNKLSQIQSWPLLQLRKEILTFKMQAKSHKRLQTHIVTLNLKMTNSKVRMN